MRQITTFGLLALVASMIVGGIPLSAEAQSDPTVALRLANNAKSQVERQLASIDNVPDQIKRLYNQGSSEVESLEEAIKNRDLDSAKRHFLKAMELFKKITEMISDRPSSVPTSDETRPQRDHSSDLQRLVKYVSSLKAAAERHGADVDFGPVDDLIQKAREQISQDDPAVKETAQELKRLVSEIKGELRGYASEKNSDRARDYAQKYLETLDRLIAEAKDSGLSDEIIQQLEDARYRLAESSDPDEIIKEIRKIISFKEQFEITKHNRIDSRVSQIETMIDRLAETDGISPDDIEQAQLMLSDLKELISDGNYQDAQELLRELTDLVKQIQSSS